MRINEDGYNGKRKEVYRICKGGKKEMMRRKVEEIQRQNTVQEYWKFSEYTKNLLKNINQDI
jgi:hypothetical protein